MASFKQAFLSKDFVYSAELPFAPDSTAESIVRDASALAESMDGILLTDNQYGQPHMSPAYAAGILRSRDLPVILQVSCRNRNRIALIGEMLGARAAGIDSVMLVRGGVLPEGFAPRPKAIMDTDAKDLIAAASILDEDERLGPTGQWLIGTSATIHTPPPDAQPNEMLAKADAGARLIIAQICHDPAMIRRYTSFLIEHELIQRLSVVVSIAVPDSVEAARWLIDNRRGTVMENRYLRALESADDPRAEAIERAAALVGELRVIPGVSGVNFASVPDVEFVKQVMAQVAA